VSDEAIFSRRAARGLVLAGGVTLAVTLLYMIFADPAGEVDVLGANSFSRSALGYRSLVEVLEHEVPVVVSRLASEHKASPTAPLLLLEPPAHRDGLDHLARVLGTARERRVPRVVVLPKWRGSRPAGRLDPSPPGWVTRVEALPLEEPRRVLATLLGDAGADAEVRRSAPAPGPAPAELPWPQLIRSSRLETVVAYGGDALIARLPGEAVYVIADPDLLNTAGLGRGDNALVVHELLIDRLAPEAFVVDEVLHGFGRSQSIWRELLDFPLICVCLHLAALLAVVLWATTGRFGRPLRPPPRLPPGKLTLLDNTARLLTLAPRSRQAVESYLELTVRQAARQASLPPGLGARQRIERLSELDRRRGVGEDLGHLEWCVSQMPIDGAEPARALALAHALYRWQKETFDGRDASP
jgi:hypothetical protein